MINFKPQIQARQADWIARRRNLHQHPESDFQEVRTAGIVAKELARLGLEVQTGSGKTGVVGVLEGQTMGQPFWYGRIWTRCLCRKKRSRVCIGICGQNACLRA
jgi:hypothetical protein